MDSRYIKPLSIPAPVFVAIALALHHNHTTWKNTQSIPNTNIATYETPAGRLLIASNIYESMLLDRLATWYLAVEKTWSASWIPRLITRGSAGPHKWLLETTIFPETCFYNKASYMERIVRLGAALQQLHQNAPEWTVEPLLHLPDTNHTKLRNSLTVARFDDKEQEHIVTLLSIFNADTELNVPLHGSATLATTSFTADGELCHVGEWIFGRQGLAKNDSFTIFKDLLHSYADYVHYQQIAKDLAAGGYKTTLTYIEFLAMLIENESTKPKPDFQMITNSGKAILSIT